VNHWLRFLKNRLEFDRERQLSFLTRIAAMVGSGIALRSVFENLLRFPANAAERGLSGHALSNISRGLPFAQGCDVMGWFDKRITALLVAGEEHHCLRQTLGGLTHGGPERLSFWRTVLLSNTRWLISLAMALAICTVLYTQQALFVQVLGEPDNLGQSMVFGLGMALWEYGLFLLSCAALLVIAIYYALYHHTGRSRDRQDQYEPYRLFRRQFALRLMPELAGLMEAGLSPVDTVELCARIYPKGYYHYRLKALSRSMASGAELTQSLSACLLERRYTGMARSLSASYPGNPQSALLELHRIMVADASSRYRALSRRLCLVIMLSLLGIIYGVMEVLYAAPQI
jgi:type II secretory pathway component PulF